MAIAWIAPTLRPRRESAARRARRQAHRRRFALEQFEDRTLLSTFTWTGASGTDLNWSTPNNWSVNGGQATVAPKSTDDVVFDSGSTDSTIDKNFAVKSITIGAGYDGTITAGANLTVNAGYSQAGGAFNAGSSTLTLYGGFKAPGGVFDPGASTAIIRGTAATIDTGDSSFHNVTLNTVWSTSLTINNMKIDGDLKIQEVGKLNGPGAIDLAGDLTSNDSSVKGTAVVRLVGAGEQTITAGVNNGMVPGLEFAKPSGKATIEGNGNTLSVNGGWSVDASNRANIVTTGSTVAFVANDYAYSTRTIDAGGHAFNNVVLNTVWSNVVNVDGSLAIKGDLTIKEVGTLNAALGAITVAGNLTSTDTSVKGNADITMLGGSTSTITAAPGDFPDGGIVIKKGSASLNVDVTTPLDGPLTIESVWALNKGSGSGVLTVGRNVITKTGVGGDATLVFAGGANQTLTATAPGAGVVGVTIAKSGGALTLNTSASNDTLRVNGSWIVDANNAGAINLNDSAIKFTAASAGAITVDADPSAMTFNDVEVAIGSNTLNAQKMIVDGKLTLTSVYYVKGVITAHGDVETAATAISSNGGRIDFAGADDQTLSASRDNGGVPAVVINKDDGALFIEGPNTINANGNWTWTKGVVDASGSTVRLTNASNVNTGPGGGGMKFNNFEIAVKDKTLKVENKLGVLGDLTVDSAWAINAAAGAITVEGDLASNSTDLVRGSANITMLGYGNVSITTTNVGDFPNGGIIIAKEGSLDAKPPTGGLVTVDMQGSRPLDGPLMLNKVKQIKGRLLVGNDVTTNYHVIRSKDGGVIVFTGDKDQKLIIGDAGRASRLPQVPAVEFDKSGGVVTLTPQGGNTLSVAGNWIAHGSSRVITDGTTVVFDTATIRPTVNSGIEANTFDDVIINIGSGDPLTAIRMNIAGDLTITKAGKIDGASGAITVAGDLTSTAVLRSGGTANIWMVGDRDATISTGDGVGSFPNGGIVIDKPGGTTTLHADVTKPLAGPLDIRTLRNFSGSLAVAGNVISRANNVYAQNGGKIVFTGDKAQTLTTTRDGARVPGVEIDKDGGSLTLNPANLITVTGDWIYKRGDVITTDSRVLFVTGGKTVDTGPLGSGMRFNDVEVAISGNLNAVNMVVAGGLNLRIAATVEGQITALGNVVASASAAMRPKNGGAILFTGDGQQTLTGRNAGLLPGVRIDKSGGDLTLIGDIGVTGPWQYAKGTVDAGTSTVTFSYQATQVDTGSKGKMAFNNAVIALGNNNLTAENLAVGGNLTINSVKDINAASGKITVGGDLISNDDSVGGNADITMIGPKDARIEGGDFPNGGIIIKQKGNATVHANVLKPLAGPLVLTKATPAKALTGTFQVANNVTSEAVSIDGNDDGSPVLVFMGDKKQTLSTGYGQMVPGVKFDKTGGSVDIVSDKGELKVSGGWIVSGVNAASINIPDEVAIRFDNAKKGNPGHREINTGDSAGFKNVILTPGGDSTVTITKMVVNGDLNTINVGELNGEPIDLYGNLITQTVNSGMTGSGAIRFVGDRDQTIMATGNARRLPNVIIEKTGSGVLSVDLDSGWINVMGNWDYNGGKVDMAGSTIRFAGTGFNGGNNYIRANGMIFNTIHFVAGDMDVLDAGNDAGELFYTGSVYKPNRVVKGTLVKI